MRKSITVYVHRQAESRKDCTIKKTLSACTDGFKIWPATPWPGSSVVGLRLKVKLSPSCLNYSKRDIMDLAESCL